MSSVAALAGLVLWASPPAAASEATKRPPDATHAPEGSIESRPVAIRAVRLEGNRRTRSETLLELLPRRPPATYLRTELAELERRINSWSRSRTALPSSRWTRADARPRGRPPSGPARA